MINNAQNIDNWNYNENNNQENYFENSYSDNSWINDSEWDDWDNIENNTDDNDVNSWKVQNGKISFTKHMICWFWWAMLAWWVYTFIDDSPKNKIYQKPPLTLEQQQVIENIDSIWR